MEEPPAPLHFVSSPFGLESNDCTFSWFMKHTDSMVTHQDFGDDMNIPTKTQVGAACLPEEIAPVKAPFLMPAFQKPVFPDVTVSVTNYEVKENVISTKGMQAAIDAVSAGGGGTVVIPAGDWLTGRLSLKSNVNLHVAEGANVTFSGHVDDYRPAVFTRNEGMEVMSLGALIYANGQHNIAVTGKGTLVGPPEECSVRQQVMESNVIEDFIDSDTPVEERVYEGHDGAPVFLPTFIGPINCKDVYIEGVTLERTAFWNIVPVYCDGVIIRGVTVNSLGIPRGDGIDIESSKNVLIEYSTLSCGDDCFTMKAGRGEDGLRVNKATENVVVRYCLALKGHGGITLGSETAGMIRNLYLHDCVFDQTWTGIRFKTRRPRGGGGERVILERIRMNQIRDKAIEVDMLGSANYVGKLATRLPALAMNPFTPRYETIIVKEILVENTPQFMSIVGIPESPFADFRIEDSIVHCKRLFRISDAKDFVFKNVTFHAQDPLMDLLDVRDVLFDHVTFKVPYDKLITTFKGPTTDNIQFKDCVPEEPVDWKHSQNENP
jgi:hypothetical protein